MSNGALGAAGGAAAASHAAAIAKAIKASGVVVRVEPAAFMVLLNKSKEPLVVFAEAGFFGRKSYQYLTSYRGLAFYTKSGEALHLPGRAEIIAAKKIWIP